MTDDPHDTFDAWRWSCTAHVTGDSDPCDEWPCYRGVETGIYFAPVGHRNGQVVIEAVL